MKKVLSVILSLLFVFGSVACCYAGELGTAEGTEPTRYAYISSVFASIDKSGFSAACTGSIICNSSATSCAIRLELQKLSDGTYETIETWSKIFYKTSGDMSETKTINPFSTYRLKVTFSAYCGSNVETAVVYAYP